MTNLFFTQPGDLLPMTKARSSDINALAAAVTAAFNKLPTPLALQGGAANFVADTGTVANAYLVAMDPTIAYTDGLEVKMRATRANTGPATVRVNALAAAPIKRIDGSDPLAGDIPAGSTLPLVYSAALGAFCLPAVVSGTLSVAVAAASQSVTNAAAQATTAGNAATASANSATASANSANASATSAAASEASRILGDKRFLGSKAAAPTVDNQGAALQAGAAYYDTTLAKIQVWTGTAWTAGIATIAGVSSLAGQTGDLAIKTVNGQSILGAGDIVTISLAQIQATALSF